MFGIDMGSWYGIFAVGGVTLACCLTVWLLPPKEKKLDKSLLAQWSWNIFNIQYSCHKTLCNVTIWDFEKPFLLPTQLFPAYQ